MELNRRDKNTLTAGGIFLVLFGIVMFVCLPAVDKADHLEEVLNGQVRTIEEMRKTSGNYQARTQVFDRHLAVLSSRPKNFTLFSFLDRQAHQSGIKQKVVNMKPASQEIENSDYRLMKVRVKLKGVYAGELVDFLARIESSRNGVGITHFSLVKSGRKGDVLDAVLEAQTLSIKEESRS